MNKRLSVALLTVAIFASQPVLAATCYSPDEAKAAQLRRFQTDLMVAALKCEWHPANMHDKYNQFVGKFGPQLSGNAQVLRGYFARAYGKDRDRRFDAFITTLANDASQKSINNDDYCEDSVPSFDEALQAQGSDLNSVAAKYVSLDTGCPAPKKAAVKAKPEAKAKPAAKAPAKAKAAPAAKQ